MKEDNKLFKQCITDANIIPTFYGQPNLDTITLEYFVSRIDECVSAFKWSQKQAYIAFTTLLRGTAASWLQYFTNVNRQNPQEWTSIRSHFCKAFNDNCDVNIYSYASSATSIYNQVSTPVPSSHTFTAAQTLIIEDLIDNALEKFSANLRNQGVKFDNTHTIPSLHGGNTFKTTNKLFCIYCRKHNHEQEKCRHRIQDKAPCCTNSGIAYFPKIKEESRSRIKDNAPGYSPSAPCYSPSGTAYFPKMINSAETAKQKKNVDSVNFDFENNSVFHETA